jgi:hypothetical protein
MGYVSVSGGGCVRLSVLLAASIVPAVVVIFAGMLVYTRFTEKKIAYVAYADVC